MTTRFLRGLVPLLLAMLACEPMIAIGKYEFLILIGLMAVLLGPPIYRFLRLFEKYRRRKSK